MDAHILFTVKLSLSASSASILQFLLLSGRNINSSLQLIPKDTFGEEESFRTIRT